MYLSSFLKINRELLARLKIRFITLLVIESLIDSASTLETFREVVGGSSFFPWVKCQFEGSDFSLALLSSFVLFFRRAKRSICERCVFTRGGFAGIRHRLAATQLSQPLPRNPSQIPFRYSRLFILRNFHLARCSPSSFFLDRISRWVSMARFHPFLNHRSLPPSTNTVTCFPTCMLQCAPTSSSRLLVNK